MRGIDNMLLTKEDIERNKQIEQEICTNIKDVLKKYVPEDKMDDVEKIIYSCAEGYVFTRKEGK